MRELKDLVRRIIFLIEIVFFKRKKNLAYKRWFIKNGDNTLRLNYNLTNKSVVVDLGGYEGEWAIKIDNKYKSKIYVFEPVKKFYEIIVNKIEQKKNIQAFNFGLGDKDYETEISILNNGSSIFRNDGEKEKIKIVEILNFLEKEKIYKIDLIKINIEGGEFDLLKHLIKSGKINMFENIQVQFHKFYMNSEEERSIIRNELVKTHHLTYDFDFIWENWQKTISFK